MADLCAEGTHPHEVGTLSKQAEAWVLITQVRDDGRLKGFAFSLSSASAAPRACWSGSRPCAARPSATRCCVRSCRTCSAGPCWPFPTRTSSSRHRFGQPGGFDAFRSLNDIVPRRPPGVGRGAGLGRPARQALRHRDPRLRPAPSWPRATVAATPQCSTTSPAPRADRRRGGGALRRPHPHKGDSLVAFGWAMEEDLRRHA